MASPRNPRRKISLPSLRTPTRARKTSYQNNRLEVIDHLDSQSHIAFLRKVSVNQKDLMYPINLILPTGVRQSIVVQSNSKLKDALEEVRDLLPSNEFESYTFQDTNTGQSLSLNSPTVGFVGTELKIVKLDLLCSLEEQKKSSRFQLLTDLCKSEKQHLDRIHQADVIYKQPLRNWGLNEAEICLLFDGTTAAEETSRNLINKLEGLIADWDEEDTYIADVFNEQFWNSHEQYINYYDLSKLTLKAKHLDPTFRNFINMQRASALGAKPTIQALILAPMQRITQYEGFMHELYLATPDDHKDKRGIELTASRFRRLSEKRSEDLQKEEQEFRIIQVQEKFPNDKLYLELSNQEYEKLRCRRNNSPSLKPKKNTSDVDSEKKENYHHTTTTTTDGEKSNGRITPPSISNSSSSNTTTALSSITITTTPSPTTSNTDSQQTTSTTATITNSITTTGSTTVPSQKRVYIMEGPVKLTNSTSTNERYFFLFNDLLIVAKVKSSVTFKLKERIPISDVWLSHCMDEVTEHAVPQERSFVIGWPTANFVASFGMSEEKDIWYNSLKKNINERKESDGSKQITIKVTNRTQGEDGTIQTCSVPITSKDDAKTVVKLSLAQFQYQNEDPNEYQLCVCSKDVSIPLIGHEIPYAIRINNLRSMQDCARDENDNPYENTCSIEDDTRYQFVLKKAKKDNSKKIIKNFKKQKIINWAKTKKSTKSPYNLQDPTTALPPGKLFGNPLTSLTTDEEPVPKAIEEILQQLFRRGPGTMGIFRKPASQRMANQLRQSLDAGKEIEFPEEKNGAFLLATVLKDFFRSLPDSLIVSEHYDNLVATKHLTEDEKRMGEIKKILQQFPRAHYELTMRFLCVLHHIQRFSFRNNMNSYNLSICVSPSIMWSLQTNKLTATEQASGSSDVVRFLIDNYSPIFGKENEYLLGEESEIQFADGAGEDSDSGTDQVISRYGDIDDREDSEKEDEPATPDFLANSSAVGDDSCVFSHSDSSLNTNDSYEMKVTINKFGVSSLNVPTADRLINGSRSSPSSPMVIRKGLEKAISSDTKLNCELSDQEIQDNDHFERKLLRQTKPKRMLSSTTASAELIEHKNNTSDSSLPPHSHIEFVRRDTMEGNTMNKESSASSIDSSNSQLSSSSFSKPLILQKHVISQPIIQHFSTEYHSTPNVIFHSVDRRRVPAAPSYEEHLQRTQSRPPKAVQAMVRKQAIVSHAAIVQHQSRSPSRSKKLSTEDFPTEESNPTTSSRAFNGAQLKLDIEETPEISENKLSSPKTTPPTTAKSFSRSGNCEERRVARVTRKPHVNKDERPSPRSPRNPTSPSFAKQQQSNGEKEFFCKEQLKPKLSERKDSMIRELLDNLSMNSDNEKEEIEQQQTPTTSSVSVATSDVTKGSLKPLINTGSLGHNRKNSTGSIEDRFNSMLDDLNHNVALNGTKAGGLSRSFAKDTSSLKPLTDIDAQSSDSDDRIGQKMSANSDGEIDEFFTTQDELESISSQINEVLSDILNPSGFVTPLKYSMSPNSSVESSITSDASQSPDHSPLSSEEKDKNPTSTRNAQQGPFSLSTKKSDSLKLSPSSTTDAKSQSLVLEKTLLTKAPKKIDQLTTKFGEKRDDGRCLSARELRRSNRKLKSEIRNAFSEGKFNLTDNSVKASIHKFNGHISSYNEENDKTLRQFQVRNKENLKKTFGSNTSNGANQLQCREKNNNNITSSSTATKYNLNHENKIDIQALIENIEKTDEDLQQDEAYAKIMAQAESYV